MMDEKQQALAALDEVKHNIASEVWEALDDKTRACIVRFLTDLVDLTQGKPPSIGMLRRLKDVEIANDQ
jgi:hypothetical protein